MPSEFPYDVFLSHRAKGKAVVRPMAERLRVAVRKHLKVGFDEWVLPVAASRQSAAFLTEGLARKKEEDGGALPRRRYAEKIVEGLEHSQSELQSSAFILQPFPDAPYQRLPGAIPLHQEKGRMIHCCSWN